MKQGEIVLLAGGAVVAYFLLKKTEETAQAVAEAPRVALDTIKETISKAFDIPNLGQAGLPLPETARVALDTIKSAVASVVPAAVSGSTPAYTAVAPVTSVMSAQYGSNQAITPIKTDSIIPLAASSQVLPGPGTVGSASFSLPVASSNSAISAPATVAAASYPAGSWQTTVTVGMVQAARASTGDKTITAGNYYSKVGK